MAKTKYFGIEYPELKSLWNEKLNVNIDPNTLISRDPTKYWWTCPSNHDYQATVRAVIDLRSCRVCLGSEIRTGVNDFKTLYPDIAKYWHPTLNADVSPDAIGVGSKSTYWWKCANDHEYKSDVWNKISGKECRRCAGFKATVGVDDLPTKNPDLAKLLDTSFHAEDALIGVHARSETSFNWVCSVGHTWEQSVRELAKKVKGPCSYCSNSLVWTGFNDLATKRPDLAKEWDYKENTRSDPNKILFQSDSIVAWRCADHNHPWKTSPYKRIYEKSNCPYCGNYKLLKGFNDLETTAPNLAREWDEKLNKVKPSSVIFGSHDKYWWRCVDGHSWDATVSSRCDRAGIRGSGCPQCAKSGFDPGAPAVLYFLENVEKGAFKVGITNEGTSRLRAFEGKGWTVHARHPFSLGADARYLERQMQTWLVVELGLSAVLVRKDMGRLGGETETFSNQRVSKSEVLEKMNLLIRARRPGG
jgi:hypothetical protein